MFLISAPDTIGEESKRVHIKMLWSEYFKPEKTLRYFFFFWSTTPFFWLDYSFSENTNCDYFNQPYILIA